MQQMSLTLIQQPYTYVAKPSVLKKQGECCLHVTYTISCELVLCQLQTCWLLTGLAAGALPTNVVEALQLQGGAHTCTCLQPGHASAWAPASGCCAVLFEAVCPCTQLRINQDML